MRGRKPDQAEDVKKAPSFGKLMLLYISGEGLSNILSAARQKILHAPEETDDPLSDQSIQAGGVPRTFEHRPHKG